MPIHTYRIELLNSAASAATTYNYQSIKGNVDNARLRVELLTRLGIDGVGIRELGNAGQPFAIEAVEHLENFGQVKTAIETYQALIGSGAEYGVRVTQHSVVQGVYGVLDVQPRRGSPRALAAVAGSLLVNPQVELRTVWTLVNQEIAP